MNIQTERLENHTARFTVEIEPQQWNQAKKDAAKEIAKQIRVKGFRKGKAPYSVVVRNVGESVIVEEAMEKLGNDVYREVITTSEYEPYAAGSLEDFQLEPQPTYIFTVPLAPEIELGDYREVRLDFEAPEVTEDDVDKAMRQYQQQEAVVEDSEEPVQSGDRITIDIDSQFADGEDLVTEANDEETEEDEASADTDEDTPKKGDGFIHQQDAIINLDPENEPVLPGFIEALVGANNEETVEFELTVPEDDETYTEEVRGRKIHFEVTIKDIKSVTLPDLDDDLAQKITEDEEDPLTLADLRARTQEQLQEQAESSANNAYADEVLGKIAEGATLSYPEIMVVERIHGMIDELDQDLQQQGMNIETYQKVMGVTHEDLHEQYEDDAIKSLERSLVLGEVLFQEGVKVTAEDVATEIDKTLAQFGEQAEIFRQFFDTEQQRASIANNLLYERVMTRLSKIGKGESLEEANDDDEEEEIVEASAEAEVADEPEATEEEADTNTNEEDSVEETADDTETSDDK